MEFVPTFVMSLLLTSIWNLGNELGCSNNWLNDSSFASVFVKSWWCYDLLIYNFTLNSSFVMFALTCNAIIEIYFLFCV